MLGCRQIGEGNDGKWIAYYCVSGWGGEWLLMCECMCVCMRVSVKVCVCVCVLLLVDDWVNVCTVRVHGSVDAYLCIFCGYKHISKYFSVHIVTIPAPLVNVYVCGNVKFRKE